MLRKMLLAPICLTLAVSASAQTQNLFFTPPLLTMSNGLANGAVTADFNGDGKLDVAFDDGTVLLSKADGTYQAGTPWCTTAQPYCSPTGAALVITADVNQDGKADLVTVTANFVWVLLGKGDGTFQAALSSVTGSQSLSILVADVNGDSKPDVLISPSGNGTITICLGKGDGTFQPAVAGPSLSGSQQIVAVVDLNGDHKTDILTATQPTPGSPQLSVFTGNGDGTFSNTAIVTNTNLPNNEFGLFDFQVADMNGDGKVDVVVSNFPTPHLGAGPFDPTQQPQATYLAHGNGDGTFATPTQIASRGGLISVGDLNGDGVADLVLQGPDVDVLLGTGGGGVALKVSYFANFSAGARAIVADFNGDGKADVFSAGALLVGNGDGTLKANAVTYFAGSPSAEGDLNQDGKTDLVVIGNDNSIEILLGDGTGRFAPGAAIPALSATQGVSSVNMADVNGDGKTDLVVATSSTSPNGWTVFVLMGNGDGTFNPPVAVAQSSQLFLRTIALADLNNDHKVDLIVSDSSGAINPLLGNGDGTFSATSAFFGGVTTGVLFVTGDFNGDGNVDLVVGQMNGLNFFPGKGDGTFGTAVPATSLISQVTAVGDFNGDGKLDLVGTSVVVLGNGDGTFKAGSTIPANNPVGVVTYTIAADLNGDGKLDLVGIASQGSAFDGNQLMVYALGNGDGTFTPVTLESVQDSFLIGPLVGDLNGDGRPDILFSFNNGIVSLLNTQPPAAPDFSETLTSPASSTVSAGQSATFGFNVAPTGSFNQKVSFTCSGAPANSTCTVSPTSVMVSGSATPVTVTVATMSGATAAPVLFRQSPTNSQRPFVLGVIGVSLVLLLAIATMPVRADEKYVDRRLRLAPAVFSLLLVSTGILLVSCGGGSSQRGSSTSSSATAAGTYTIKVTGTSGSGSSAVSHAVSFTLVVQ